MIGQHLWGTNADKIMAESGMVLDPAHGWIRISRDASSRVMEQAPSQAARDLGVGHFCEVGHE